MRVRKREEDLYLWRIRISVAGCGGATPGCGPVVQIGGVAHLVVVVVQYGLDPFHCLRILLGLNNMYNCNEGNSILTMLQIRKYGSGLLENYYLTFKQNTGTTDPDQINVIIILV